MNAKCNREQEWTNIILDYFPSSQQKSPNAIWTQFFLQTFILTLNKHPQFVDYLWSSTCPDLLPSVLDLLFTHEALVMTDVVITNSASDYKCKRAEGQNE